MIKNCQNSRLLAAIRHLKSTRHTVWHFSLHGKLSSWVSSFDILGLTFQSEWKWGTLWENLSVTRKTALAWTIALSLLASSNPSAYLYGRDNGVPWQIKKKWTEMIWQKFGCFCSSGVCLAVCKSLWVNWVFCQKFTLAHPFPKARCWKWEEDNCVGVRLLHFFAAFMEFLILSVASSGNFKSSFSWVRLLSALAICNSSDQLATYP